MYIEHGVGLGTLTEEQVNAVAVQVLGQELMSSGQSPQVHDGA
jgi:hypothetical protein